MGGRHAPERVVAFPGMRTHSKYTGQDVFFPLSGQVDYQLTRLPNAGGDPRHAREALFSFFVNVAYLNIYVNGDDNEQNYSILVHTSGKKIDHRTDWGTMQAALRDLLDQDADSGDCGQGFRLIADSESDRSRTAFR